MRILILGTRGIPNHYGGFEQFAQYLAKGLVEAGHEVYVYCSSLHPNKDDVYEGIHRIRCFDPENFLGTAGQFIYDLNCILDSRKRNADIILQLGYTSSAIWYFLLPKKPIVVTNMDGLEWKRQKYHPWVRKFLKFSEQLAATHSDHLIADSLAIQKYLKGTYNKHSYYLPYGANVYDRPDINALKDMQISAYDYYLLIARMEPENNIETILQGYVDAGSKKKMLVIGSTKSKYGDYIYRKFNNKGVVFLGSIFDIEVLNNLRYFAYLYFHGHSVGGTNPSLLEAMSCNVWICAHENEFNASILGEDAIYFQSSADVCNWIKHDMHQLTEKNKTNNIEKIKTQFSWPQVIADYESLMRKLYDEHLH
jgi:glycosyltransferase involved in cell wall biosynthesis